MAVSTVEQRILGNLSEETAASNALLSSCLFQTLGLSVVLSQQLTKARSQRKLDYTRNTKSTRLYHHIIWLAREGLSITEVFILPYCQDGEQGRECRVMAAKMRASFYHIFCLFHNHPPLFQLHSNQPFSPSTPRPGAIGRHNTQSEKRPGDRDSTVSDSSYVTNPWADPAQSPPPSYPIPPLPSTPHRHAPLRPPGFSPQRPSPPSSASYLLPSLNFIPAADNYFRIANSLATRFLPGAHPLRLSVAHDFAAFLSDCAGENDTSASIARDAVRAAYGDQSHLSDREWEDSLVLVQSLTLVAQRGMNTVKATPINTVIVPNTVQPTSTDPLQPLSAPSLVSDELDTTPRSATLVNSPITAFYESEAKPRIAASDAARRSQASSRNSRRGRQEGTGTEKERKRRAVQRAEMEISRKGSEQSSLSRSTDITSRRQ